MQCNKEQTSSLGAAQLLVYYCYSSKINTLAGPRKATSAAAWASSNGGNDECGRSPALDLKEDEEAALAAAADEEGSAVTGASNFLAAAAACFFKVTASQSNLRKAASNSWLVLMFIRF